MIGLPPSQLQASSGMTEMSKSEYGFLRVMMREFALWLDVAALFADPVFYGIRVAPGDGKLVVVIPGFMGSDLYLAPMLNWLYRVGYTAVRSTLNLSAGCLHRSCEQVKSQIERYLRDEQRPVALIGHSRGGAVAWALASQMPERVSHLVMLGAPIPGFHRSVENGTHSLPLGDMARMLLHANKFSRRMLHPDCRFPSCDCEFANHAERPLNKTTAILSIYGSDDLLIPKEAKILEGEVIHVRTSHVGLAYHPEVYRVLARFLAHDQASGSRPLRQARRAQKMPYRSFR
jgi:pimeloyl-ACP methyl ester carboxylesterase